MAARKVLYDYHNIESDVLAVDGQTMLYPAMPLFWLSILFQNYYSLFYNMTTTLMYLAESIADSTPYPNFSNSITVTEQVAFIAAE